MTLTAEYVSLVDEGDLHHRLPAVPLPVRVALEQRQTNPQQLSILSNHYKLR